MSEFTEIPDRALEESIEYDTMVTGFENGVEQRRLRSANGRRIFKLTFRNRTDSEIDSIRTFWTGKYGSLTSFTWTNPNDATEYTVRFMENTFKITRTGYDSFDCQLGLMQIV
jgi:phage-related protein